MSLTISLISLPDISPSPTLSLSFCYILPPRLALVFNTKPMYSSEKNNLDWIDLFSKPILIRLSRHCDYYPRLHLYFQGPAPSPWVRQLLVTKTLGHQGHHLDVEELCAFMMCRVVS